MLSIYKFLVHAIFVLLYGGLACFIFCSDDYLLQFANIIVTFSGLCILALAIILIIAYCSKRKKHYYYLLVPVLTNLILDIVFSSPYTRYETTNGGVWYSHGYETTWFLGISCAIFYILMFIKLKNNGSIWDTLMD